MFLRKTIKNFGLFILMSCIIISTQNETITVKAANNGSEIRIDGGTIDTIQPSQIYVTKISPDADWRKIETLAINVVDKMFVMNTSSQDTSYHYAVSFWLNGINVTSLVTSGGTPLDTYNGWELIGANERKILNLSRIDPNQYEKETFENGNTFKYIEFKISKIKCDKTSSVKKQELSCTTDGITTYTCTCGNKYDEIIKATGHTYITKQTNYPTVYNAGTMDLYCTKCGDESISEISQYEFNVSIGGSQLKAVRLGHKLLFANTHKDAKYIPFVVPNGKSVFDEK